MQAIHPRRLALWAALAVTASALAACGGHGGQMAVITPPPPPPKLEDGFGGGFGNLFRASANSEPVKPMATDVNAVDPSAAPTLLH
jgi:hypothetical protein